MYEILHELLEKSFTPIGDPKGPLGFSFILVMLTIVITSGIVITQLSIQVKNIVESIVSWRKAVNQRQLEIDEGSRKKLIKIQNSLDDVLEDLHTLKQTKKNKHEN